MPEALRILLAAAFTIGVCLAAGRLLLDLTGVLLFRGERNLVAFVCGSACLSLLVFALAAVHLARVEIFAILGAASIAAALWRGRREPASKSLPPLPRPWTGLLAVAMTVYGIFYFVHALAPEASPDGSAHHLGLVALYLRHGGLVRVDSMFGYLAQGVEMLYLFAFAFGRHSAAALVHFAFLAALPLLILCYARRLGRPEAGVVAAALVFASPVMGVDGTTAYVDVALACVLFTVFHLMRVWVGERQPGLLVAAGLCAGFCYGIKLTAALAVPYALATVVWTLRRQWRALLRPAAAVTSCAALMMAPWIVRNWIWTGNPFSPFLNRLFPNPYISIAFEEFFVEFNRHLPGLASRWEVPWQMTVRGGTEGMFGPVYLLAPLGILALAHPAGRVLAAAAALFAAPLAFSSSTRYVIPLLPFLTLLPALVLARRPKVAALVVLVHLALSWPAVRDLYAAPGVWNLRGFPLGAALRTVPEDAWLRENLSGYANARMVDRLVPPDARVFTYVGSAQAYTASQYAVEWVSARNKRLCDVLWTPISGELNPAWRWRFPLSGEPVRAVRVIETDAGPDVWSVSELRVYSQGRELPRDPAWRLRASPNPWGVQDAFDNTELTRWSSGERMRPGMFVEVDFGSPRPVDAVEAIGTRDQQAVELCLARRLPDGKWIPPGRPAERLERPWPLSLLRAEAAEEFRRAGVPYLLIDDGAFGADDFRNFAPQWGLQLLGQEGTARLYRFR